MKKRIISRFRNILRRYDIELTRPEFVKISLDALALIERSNIIGLMQDKDLRLVIELLKKSPSQLGQDIVVLSQLNWKTGGYFVEFGATDGHLLSNTWLLEKEFGWTGILAEPARVWRSALTNSGRSARVEFDCVWDKTGENLIFDQTDMSELSTIASFADGDAHSSSRKNRKQYAVTTISLNDLLAKHGAPAKMDFLSIDTEGSELQILESFDFDKYQFTMIACEHNFTDHREKIFQLLTKNGYSRKFEEYSKFDDWYFYQG